MQLVFRRQTFLFLYSINLMSYNLSNRQTACDCLHFLNVGAEYCCRFIFSGEANKTTKNVLSLIEAAGICDIRYFWKFRFSSKEFFFFVCAFKSIKQPTKLNNEEHSQRTTNEFCIFFPLSLCLMQHLI